MFEKAECSAEILDVKRNCIINMIINLTNSHTPVKTYWALFNRLLHNKNNTRNTTIIGRWKTWFSFLWENKHVGNIFCINMYSYKNASTLPSFSYRKNTRIKSFNISEKDILSIIKSLNPTKAHGCDNLLIKMIKNCKEVLTIPLKLIFDQWLTKGKFPKI